MHLNLMFITNWVNNLSWQCIAFDTSEVLLLKLSLGNYGTNRTKAYQRLKTKPILQTFIYLNEPVFHTYLTYKGSLQEEKSA